MKKWDCFPNIWKQQISLKMRQNVLNSLRAQPSKHKGTFLLNFHLSETKLDIGDTKRNKKWEIISIVLLWYWMRTSRDIYKLTSFTVCVSRFRLRKNIPGEIKWSPPRSNLCVRNDQHHRDCTKFNSLIYLVEVLQSGVNWINCYILTGICQDRIRGWKSSK